MDRPMGYCFGYGCTHARGQDKWFEGRPKCMEARKVVVVVSMELERMRGKTILSFYVF